MGDVENAKKYLLMSYEVNPALYHALFKLGVIEYEQGNYQRSKEYMLKAVEINPTFEPAQKAIISLDMLITEAQTK
jgi:tetratricopeptide (TPR) repeat protein